MEDKNEKHKIKNSKLPKCTDIEVTVYRKKSILLKENYCADADISSARENNVFTDYRIFEDITEFLDNWKFFTSDNYDNQEDNRSCVYEDEDRVIDNTTTIWLDQNNNVEHINEKQINANFDERNLFSAIQSKEHSRMEGSSRIFIKSEPPDDYYDSFVTQNSTVSNKISLSPLRIHEAQKPTNHIKAHDNDVTSDYEGSSAGLFSDDDGIKEGSIDPEYFLPCQMKIKEQSTADSNGKIVIRSLNSKEEKSNSEGEEIKEWNVELRQNEKSESKEQNLDAKKESKLYHSVRSDINQQLGNTIDGESRILTDENKAQISNASKQVCDVGNEKPLHNCQKERKILSSKIQKVDENIQKVTERMKEIRSVWGLFETAEYENNGMQELPRTKGNVVLPQLNEKLTSTFENPDDSTNLPKEQSVWMRSGQRETTNDFVNNNNFKSPKSFTAFIGEAKCKISSTQTLLSSYQPQCTVKDQVVEHQDNSNGLDKSKQKFLILEKEKANLTFVHNVKSAAELLSMKNDHSKQKVNKKHIIEQISDTRKRESHQIGTQYVKQRKLTKDKHLYSVYDKHATNKQKNPYIEWKNPVDCQTNEQRQKNCREKSNRWGFDCHREKSKDVSKEKENQNKSLHVYSSDQYFQTTNVITSLELDERKGHESCIDKKMASVICKPAVMPKPNGKVATKNHETQEKSKIKSIIIEKEKGIRKKLNEVWMSKGLSDALKKRSFAIKEDVTKVRKQIYSSQGLLFQNDAKRFDVEIKEAIAFNNSIDRLLQAEKEFFNDKNHSKECPLQGIQKKNDTCPKEENNLERSCHVANSCSVESKESQEEEKNIKITIKNDLDATNEKEDITNYPVDLITVDDKQNNSVKVECVFPTGKTKMSRSSGIRIKKITKGEKTSKINNSRKCSSETKPSKLKEKRETGSTADSKTLAKKTKQKKGNSLMRIKLNQGKRKSRKHNLFKMTTCDPERNMKSSVNQKYRIFKKAYDKFRFNRSCGINFTYCDESGDGNQFASVPGPLSAFMANRSGYDRCCSAVRGPAFNAMCSFYTMYPGVKRVALFEFHRKLRDELKRNCDIFFYHSEICMYSVVEPPGRFLNEDIMIYAIAETIRCACFQTFVNFINGHYFHSMYMKFEEPVGILRYNIMTNWCQVDFIDGQFTRALPAQGPQGQLHNPERNIARAPTNGQFGQLSNTRQSVASVVGTNGHNGHFNCLSVNNNVSFSSNMQLGRQITQEQINRCGVSFNGPRGQFCNQRQNLFSSNGQLGQFNNKNQSNARFFSSNGLMGQFINQNDQNQFNTCTNLSNGQRCQNYNQQKNNLCVGFLSTWNNSQLNNFRQNNACAFSFDWTT